MLIPPLTVAYRMGLDVEVPAPPDLNPHIDAAQYDDAEVVGSDDYRREELNEYLDAGAWVDAWAEWEATTDLRLDEYEIIRDLGLFEDFDFFWDDFADRVGYHAPGIPEDWQEKQYHPDLDTWNTVSGINAALTELGQIVSDILKDDYIEWESAFEPPDDLPDFEED